MGIKLRKVEIRNFKLFDDFSVQFENPQLVLFDGPNGFGKTSFYDAIEFLFTGKIRRYIMLADVVSDKRENFKENSFLNHQSKGDLVIKIELEVDGQNKILMRKGIKGELEKATKVHDFNLPLYELTSFDNEAGKVIKNEVEFMTGILNKNYSENFGYLNYIEQEENTYLLKNKDKARKEAIGHLFNTLEFEAKIESITNVSSKIGELCGQSEAKRIQTLHNELVEDEKAIMSEVKEVEYLRLIKWNIFDWDQEEIEFKGGRYAELMGEEGLINKIKTFVLNIDEFLKKIENDNLNKLLENELLLKQLLIYSKFFEKHDEYTEKLLQQKEIQRIQVEYNKGILQAILDRKIEIDKLKKLLSDKINFETYNEAIENILRLHKMAGTFSEVVASLKDSRKTFIDHFHRYEKGSGEKKDCPLCGFEWKSTEEFRGQIDSQTEKINQLTKESGKELDDAITKFEKNFAQPVLEIFQKHVDKNLIDVEFVKQLQESFKSRDKIKNLHQRIILMKVEVEDLFNTEPSSKNEAQIIILKNRINSAKKGVDNNKIQLYFSDIFLKFFNEKVDLVKGIDVTNFEKKRSYLNWKYAIYQSNTIKKKKEDYEAQKIRFDNAGKLKARVDELREVYRESLKEYEKELIGDIEILFHIYSGRIIQDYQGGLGLFIFDKNGIRFLEDPERSHDAVFSMSSGQISALIIAFTLTLNKKYSQNKVLFIDDPVQTLDELNIAGLVELLRNEFSDRQIFLSTHEDKISAYIRYKFDKFKLKTQRVSFKEKYFESAPL